MAIPLRGNDPSLPEIPEETEVRSSADVPAYDTYPGEPLREVDWKRRQERWREFGTQNPRLNETAEKIGSAVGDMVNRAEEVRRRFVSIKQDVRQSSSSRVEEIKQRAQDRLEDWKQNARGSAEEARDRMMRRAREFRVKTRDYVAENPHHVILGIAGAAFVLGLTARIWRWQRV